MWQPYRHTFRKITMYSICNLFWLICNHLPLSVVHQAAPFEVMSLVIFVKRFMVLWIYSLAVLNNGYSCHIIFMCTHVWFIGDNFTAKSYKPHLPLRDDKLFNKNSFIKNSFEYKIFCNTKCNSATANSMEI